MRKTKHASKVYEDILYSYVIIRRGSRPTGSTNPATRDGAVAREEAAQLERKGRMMEGGSGVVEVLEDGDLGFRGNPPAIALQSAPISENDRLAMIRESYDWPRVIYPPLKRSGHVILDSCTNQGKRS